MKYRIVDDQDNVLESDLVLAEAEYLLSCYLNNGVDAWMEEQHPT